MARYEIDNRPSPIEFECDGSAMLQRTIQNAKNLLLCRMGEVPYDRYRGFNPALLDLPMNELRLQLIPELDRVMMWEPDVEVVDAEVTLDENGEVYIRVILEIDL